MVSELKGCFNLGEVDPQKTVSFKWLSPGQFSLKISNFESSCEVVLSAKDVKELIGQMVNTL